MTKWLCYFTKFNATHGRCIVNKLTLQFNNNNKKKVFYINFNVLIIRK